jgi:biopolymer transport protein TolR
MAEINVVPYIDVTLVLLVIFMVTAPMLQTGVDVELPKAEAHNIDPSEQTPVIVTINKDGLVFVDLDNQGDREVAESDLAATVAAVLAGKPAVPVLIRGDRKVEYGRVVEVMARLKTAGVPSVGLMTNAAEQ